MMSCAPTQRAATEELPPSFHEYAGDLSNVSALLRTGAITHVQAQAMIAAKWGMASEAIRIPVFDPDARDGVAYPR